MTRTFLLTFAILFVSTPLAAAQEAVELKAPLPCKGEVHRVEFTVNQSMRTQRLDPFGNDLANQANAVGSMLAYRDELLEVEQGKPTHFRRHFEAATETLQDANPSARSCHGKTVLVDLRGGGRLLTWEGGAPAADTFTQQMEAALTGGKANLGAINSFEPFPVRPVKVGESWAIDVSALVKECETKNGCTLTGASGVGTLKQIYQGPQGPCGRVEVHIHVPFRTIKTGAKEMALNEGSGATLDAVYDLAVDGRSNYFVSAARLRFAVTGSAAEPDGTTSRLRLEVTAESKEQRGQ